MTKHLLIFLSYNGLKVCGSTNLPGYITAYSLIKNALKIMCDKVSVRFYCRTDKGVHASIQICTLSIEKDIDIKSIKSLINKMCFQKGLIVEKIISISRPLKFTDIEYRTYKFSLMNYDKRTVYNESFFTFCDLPKIEDIEKHCNTVCEEVFQSSQKTFIKCWVINDEKNDSINIYIKASGFERYMVRKIVFNILKRSRKGYHKIANEKLEPTGLFLVDIGIKNIFFEDCT